MSNYSSLKATINANIKANNNHEITGAITNSVLNAMVNSLGAGYQFMGVATPTNPGSAQTPDYKCFYLATTPGTYTNLGGLVVADGEVAILKYDSSWHKEVTGAATAKQLNQLGQEVDVLNTTVGELETQTGIIRQLNDFGSFAKGRLGNDGVYLNDIQYRIATPDIITIPERFVVNIAAGFRLYVVLYNGTTLISAQWVNNGYVFQSGTKAKLSIAREVDDTSEVADIDLFCSKVKLDPEIGAIKDIKDLQYNVDYLEGNAMQIDNFGVFLRGKLGRDGIYSSNVQYRIATKDAIIISGKFTVDTADGFRLYVVLYNGSSVVSAQWVNSGYLLQSGSKVKLSVARVTEDTSEIADIDLFCSKVNLVPLNEQQEEINVLEQAVENIIGNPQQLDNFGTFAKGNVTSTGSYNATVQYRVATPEILVIPEEYVTDIADGFRLYVVLYNGSSVESAKWVDNGYIFPANSHVKVNIARVNEDTSETADVDLFCSKVKIRNNFGTKQLRIDIDSVDKHANQMDARRENGIVWDWWISVQSVDQFGNVYIGYIDNEGFQGVLRKQPDGTVQYTRLCESANNDDHNGLGTLVLPDGRILVMGAYAHRSRPLIRCYRSIKPYNIDEFEDLCFTVSTDDGSLLLATYGQLFAYDNKLYDFMRFSYVDSQDNETIGWTCLVSTDNGDTWSEPYKVGYGSAIYLALAQCTDNPRYIKFVKGVTPNTEPAISGGTWLFGGYFDLAELAAYNLSGTKVGDFGSWGGPMDEGSIDMSRETTQLTRLVQQTLNNVQCRLLYTAKTPLANTIFLYARATSSDNNDYIYNVYNDGDSAEIAHSGLPFGSVSYMSGACFGYAPNIIYYAKCIGNKSDGPHELHRAIIDGENIVDVLIATSSICMIRPLYCDNGMIVVANGYYHDGNGDGSEQGNYFDWTLNPRFLQG